MPIEIADLSGDAHTRGGVYGAARRKQIHAHLSDWLGSLRAGHIPDPHAYILQMLRDTDFVTSIRKHSPDLLEEVQGMASGAEQPFELLLAAQLMDEEWAYRPSFLSRAEAMQKCSSVAIRSQKGFTWLGQNMDLGSHTDGHQVLLRISPHLPEHGALVFTIGSMIALMGVNARGVGVCVNSLPQLPVAREGLPVAFVIRKLLQAESLAEAVRAVQAIPHATGQHYLIADPSGIRSFEASPTGVLEYHPPDPSRVFHTNHPLTEEKGASYSAKGQANTLARLRSLTNRLMTGTPELHAIQVALSSSDDPSHPVCRVLSPNDHVNSVSGMTSFTTGSMISRLSPDQGRIDAWISPGPPSIRGYVRVSMPAM